MPETVIRLLPPATISVLLSMLLYSVWASVEVEVSLITWAKTGAVLLVRIMFAD